jgi:hypothetical protein
MIRPGGTSVTILLRPSESMPAGIYMCNRSPPPNEGGAAAPSPESTANKVAARGGRYIGTDTNSPPTRAL